MIERERKELSMALTPVELAAKELHDHNETQGKLDPQHVKRILERFKERIEHPFRQEQSLAKPSPSATGQSAVLKNPDGTDKTIGDIKPISA